MTDQLKILDPFSMPLDQVSLIEASAGSGKTYTIVNLYLRLLLRLGEDQSLLNRRLKSTEILVVTFTKAATAEMRERIQKKLFEFQNYLTELQVQFEKVLPGKYQTDAYLTCLRVKEENQKLEQQRQAHREKLLLERLKAKELSAVQKLQARDLDQDDSMPSDAYHLFADCLVTVNDQTTAQPAQKSVLDLAIAAVVEKFDLSDEFYSKCLRQIIAEGRVKSSLEVISKQLQEDNFAISNIDSFTLATIRANQLATPVSTYNFDAEQKALLQEQLRQLLRTRFNKRVFAQLEEVPLFVPGQVTSWYFDATSDFLPTNWSKDPLPFVDWREQKGNFSGPKSFVNWLYSLIDTHTYAKVEKLARRYGVFAGAAALQGTENKSAGQQATRPRTLSPQALLEQQRREGYLLYLENKINPNPQYNQFLDKIHTDTGFDPAQSRSKIPKIAENERIKLDQDLGLGSMGSLNLEAENLEALNPVAASPAQQLANLSFDAAALEGLFSVDKSVDKSAQAASQAALLALLEKHGLKLAQTEEATATSATKKAPEPKAGPLDHTLVKSFSDFHLTNDSNPRYVVYWMHQWLIWFGYECYERYKKAQAKARTVDFSGYQLALLELLEDQDVLESIRQTYRYAIIDEFQDTSPRQFEIFKKIFIDRMSLEADKGAASATSSAVPVTAAAPVTAASAQAAAGDTGFIMIGDPKQAIYEFRGADIFAYFQAKEYAKNSSYTINNNFRSTPAFIEACNLMFGARFDGFGLWQINYPIAGAGNKAKPGLTLHGVEVSPVTLVNLAKIGFNLDTKAKFSDQEKEELQQEFAKLGLDEPSLPKDTFAYAAKIAKFMIELGKRGHLKVEGRNLVADDICFLERKNEQLRELEQALKREQVNVKATVELLNSNDPASLEALRYFLKAVYDQKDTGAITQYLYSVLSGLSFGQTTSLINNSQAYAQQVQRLTDYKKIWEQRGLLALVNQVILDNDLLALAQADLQQNKSTLITQLQDILSITDFIIENCPDLDEPALVIYFLENLDKITTQEDRSEVAKSALEEQDSVHLMTIHKSKGLQFSVVISSQISQVTENETGLEIVKLLPLMSDFYDPGNINDHNLVDDILRGSSARLLYVALTRAKCAFIGFVDNKFLGHFANAYNKDKVPDNLQIWSAPVQPNLATEPFALSVQPEQNSQSSNTDVVTNNLGHSSGSPALTQLQANLVKSFNQLYQLLQEQLAPATQPTTNQTSPNHTQAYTAFKAALQAQVQSLLEPTSLSFYSDAQATKSTNPGKVTSTTAETTAEATSTNLNHAATSSATTETSAATAVPTVTTWTQAPTEHPFGLVMRTLNNLIASKPDLGFMYIDPHALPQAYAWFANSHLQRSELALCYFMPEHVALAFNQVSPAYAHQLEATANLLGLNPAQASEPDQATVNRLLKRWLLKNYLEKAPLAPPSLFRANRLDLGRLLFSQALGLGNRATKLDDSLGALALTLGQSKSPSEGHLSQASDQPHTQTQQQLSQASQLYRQFREQMSKLAHAHQQIPSWEEAGLMTPEEATNYGKQALTGYELEVFSQDLDQATSQAVAELSHQLNPAPAARLSQHFKQITDASFVSVHPGYPNTDLFLLLHQWILNRQFLDIYNRQVRVLESVLKTAQQQATETKAQASEPAEQNPADNKQISAKQSTQASSALAAKATSEAAAEVQASDLERLATLAQANALALTTQLLNTKTKVTGDLSASTYYREPQGLKARYDKLTNLGVEPSPTKFVQAGPLLLTQVKHEKASFSEVPTSTVYLTKAAPTDLIARERSPQNSFSSLTGKNNKEILFGTHRKLAQARPAGSLAGTAGLASVSHGSAGTFAGGTGVGTTGSSDPAALSSEARTASAVVTAVDTTTTPTATSIPTASAGDLAGLGHEELFTPERTRREPVGQSRLINPLQTPDSLVYQADELADFGPAPTHQEEAKAAFYLKQDAGVEEDLEGTSDPHLKANLSLVDDTHYITPLRLEARTFNEPEGIYPEQLLRAQPMSWGWDDDLSNILDTRLQEQFLTGDFSQSNLGERALTRKFAEHAEKNFPDSEAATSQLPVQELHQLVLFKQLIAEFNSQSDFVAALTLDLGTCLKNLPAGVDFGNLVHAFLENWRPDPSARESNRENLFMLLAPYKGHQRQAVIRLLFDTLLYPVVSLAQLRANDLLSTRDWVKIVGYFAQVAEGEGWENAHQLQQLASNALPQVAGLSYNSWSYLGQFVDLRGFSPELARQLGVPALPAQVQARLDALSAADSKLLSQAHSAADSADELQQTPQAKFKVKPPSRLEKQLWLEQTLNLSAQPSYQQADSPHLRLGAADFGRICEWEFNINTEGNEQALYNLLNVLFKHGVLEAPSDDNLRSVIPDLLTDLKFTGKVDLIAIGKEEIIVADYKTNNLGSRIQPSLADYHPASLTDCMVQAGYLLQIYIYLAAVYAYARSEIFASDQVASQVKFVGINLFNRGLLAQRDPASALVQPGNFCNTGVYVELPTAQLLQELADTLTPEWRQER